MRLADAPAVEHHAVARFPSRVRTRADSAGEVDARNHRKAPHDRRLASQRQAVLVVERAPLDAHGDVALRQHGIVDLLHRSLVTGLILGDQDSLEHGDSPLDDHLKNGRFRRSTAAARFAEWETASGSGDVELHYK